MTIRELLSQIEDLRVLIPDIEGRELRVTYDAGEGMLSLETHNLELGNKLNIRLIAGELDA